MVRHSASVTPLFPTVLSAPQRVAAELVALLPRAQLAASYEYQLSYAALFAEDP